jgi:hypothetical protein
MARAKPPKDPESPPERHNWVDAVSRDAAPLGAAAFARAGFSDPTLVLHWEKIAGAEVARLARPLRLSQGPQGGVLTLMAEPAAAVFLSHETRALAERINTYLGRPAVARLKFVHAALTQPETLPPQLKPAKDVAPDDPVRTYSGPEGLREALWRLARARRSQSR